MKIILSRKGFDSSNSTIPSPILPDGTMLSMPIPSDDPYTYADYGLAETLEKLKPAKGKDSPWAQRRCHFDPDLKRGAFGQAGAAATHLLRQGVEAEGGLFLFFGWFRRVDEQYRYCGPDFHAIYGYMLVPPGSVISDNEIITTNYPWHPHAAPRKNNRLYIPSDWGMFKFDDDLVLTKPGQSRSRWAVQDWMRDAHITYHNGKSFIEDYFQSAAIGQEFVITDETGQVEAWAQSLITAVPKG